MRTPRNVSGKGLAAVVVWGASFAATSVALRAFNPFGLVTVRLLCGAFLLGLILRMKGGRPLPAREDLPSCVFLGGVLAAHLLVQAYGLRLTSSSNTGWIIGFIPVMIALGAQLFGRQRLGRMGWLGVLIGTGGVLAVALAKQPDFLLARLGNLLQVVSCLTWTVYTLAACGPMARNGVLRVTACAMGVAAVLCTLATIYTGVFIGRVGGDTLLAVAYLGLVCSGAAYYLWFAAVDEHGPARTSALLYFEPFVALAVGAILLNETITPVAVVGGLGVLAGVWLVSKGTKTRGE